MTPTLTAKKFRLNKMMLESATRCYNKAFDEYQEALKSTKEIRSLLDELLAKENRMLSQDGSRATANHINLTVLHAADLALKKTALDIESAKASLEEKMDAEKIAQRSVMEKKSSLKFIEQKKNQMLLLLQKEQERKQDFEAQEVFCVGGKSK